MTHHLNRASKLAIALTALLYGIYLLKTAMGINISNQYSAAWIFKAPLMPLWAFKTELCGEFQTLCTLRHQIQHKVQRRINRAKHLDQA